MLAGCRDNEYSYDAVFAKRPNGAFTFVALRALRLLNAGATYADWYKMIRRGLPSEDYPQRPQLGATRTQRKWVIFE